MYVMLTEIQPYFGCITTTHQFEKPTYCMLYIARVSSHAETSGVKPPTAIGTENAENRSSVPDRTVPTTLLYRTFMFCIRIQSSNRNGVLNFLGYAIEEVGFVGQHGKGAE